MKPKSYGKICMLAVVPSLTWVSGDSVNERQLLEALSRRVGKTIVFSFTPFNKRKRLVRPIFHNDVLIELPLIPYFGIPLKFFYSFIAAFVGQLLDTTYGLDLIYVRDTLSAFGFVLSRKMMGKMLVKYGAFIEDELRLKEDPVKLIKKCFQTIDRLVLSRCKKIGIPSYLWVRQLLIRRRIIRPSSDYIIMPAGVSLRRISKIVNELTLKNLDPNIKIGFVGSLNWWQGADILARACVILRNKIPNIKLIFIGDGEYRQLIEEICTTNNLNYKITGYLPHEEALKHFATLDAMVLPSLKISTTTLNIPIKIIEGLALGVPLIVTKHEVFTKYGFRNLEDVIYCEPEPLSVANAIMLLLENSTLKEKLKKKGRLLATQFDYDKMAEYILDNVVNS